MKGDVAPELVVELLGNDVSAILSVPTAYFYCFLRAQQPIDGIEVSIEIIMTHETMYFKPFIHSFSSSF